MFSVTELISVAEMTALLQVIVIDLVLAGDNAIVVGLVAASLPAKDRPRVIAIGIIAATVMRIGFAAVTVQLLQIVGLLLAGGLLLLWVSWKLWREIQTQRKTRHASDASIDEAVVGEDQAPNRIRAAVFKIIVADVSMSLDNVLAVAGVAREHLWVLVVGLTLSVAFMGFAATWIARLLERHAWIAYVGLAIIFYIAIAMIIEGALDMWNTNAWNMRNIITGFGSAAS